MNSISHIQPTLLARVVLCLVTLVTGALVTADDVAIGEQPIQAKNAEPIRLKFSFGNGPAQPEFIAVPHNAVYGPESAHGYDLGTRPAAIHADGVASTSPFYFSVCLPEGNYDVTLTLGSDQTASDNTVKAESRRLMLERVVTKPREAATARFTANIRTPAIADGDHVGLKTREKGVLHWDNKLTIELNGPHPAVRTIEITSSPMDTVTVYLLGDSTVTDQPREPWNSWGQMLTRFFGPGVAIANHAESGESLKGSLRARRVKKVLTSLRPGDYVFVQFGHNDMKDSAPDALATYKANLTNLVEEIRERGGIPVLVTSMERKSGVKNPTLKDYPQTVRDVARDHDVVLLDLNQLSLNLYRALGDQLDAAFQDGSHHNAYGSYELARCLVQEIRQALPELAQHIRSDVSTFDPSHPDPVDRWNIPASPSSDLTKPDGS